MNLKSKTALFATSIAIAVLLLCSWISLHIAEREILRRTVDQQQAVASRLAGEIAGKAALAQRALVNVAAALPADAAPSTLPAFLDSKPALQAVFSDVVVFSADGTILADKPVVRGRAGSNLAGRDYFRRTMDSGRPVISGPLTGAFTKAPVTLLTAPVFDRSGNVARILAGVIRLSERNFLGGIADMPVGEQGFALLVTRDREIVMHRQQKRMLSRLDGAWRGLERAADGQVLTEETDAPGFSALVSYAPVSDTDWVLATVLPLAEVRAPIDNMRQAIGWFTLALLVVVPLLGWFGAAYLMRPLGALRQAIRSMQERPGSYTEAPVAGRDEIGELAASFNQMTRARQQAEQELRELNQTLERRVAERTAKLRAINEELEAFGYSVSHDLRAPLRAINGFSAMLSEQCAGKLGDEEQRLLERVVSNANRMGELIDDLLALSRIARAELSCERTDISSLCDEIIGALREREPQRRVICACPSGAAVWGDPHLLRIALENLLGNAWKYSSRRDLASIECTVRRDARESIVSVADNGAGFDMAFADKLFGAFQRLHPATDFEGTGIGLALVKRIVVRHGGRIWVEAEPDRGAVFHIALPEPADLDRPTEPAGSTRGRPGGTLLASRPDACP